MVILDSKSIAHAVGCACRKLLRDLSEYDLIQCMTISARYSVPCSGRLRASATEQIMSSNQLQSVRLRASINTYHILLLSRAIIHILFDSVVSANTLSNIYPLSQIQSARI